MVAASQSTDAEKVMISHFLKTFSDTAGEPFLILNSDLVVVGANESFLRNFRVTIEETINKLVYNLGNSQWDIPELRNLLENILPKKKFLTALKFPMYFPILV